MTSTRSADNIAPADTPSKATELKTFLLLTIVFAPVTAVVCVGGYGFMVWMSQIILGPPVG